MNDKSSRSHSVLTLLLTRTQKAGITFQVDNRLPNLVNLSEDPQLSETLLYVIQEGTTAVGKRGPTSRPDIQLSGALVADEHCTISHVDGTVSIAPVGEARTYVNGTHVLGPTVLHHVRGAVRQAKALGSGRAIHVSAFQSENALSCVLEAEIQEAQLRAKQEMLQGIQVAKEVAEQELSSQRAAFEGRIEALQAELKEESQRKRLQEMSNQKAHLRIEELERAKQRLEQEVQANRRRLQLERLAAQQALEDHSVRHTRILEALEAEKQKIAQEVQALQQNQGSRDRAPPVPTSWGSLKLSLMIQEANALSGRSQRQYVFGRHEAPDRGGGPGPRVRVRNLRLGVSTLWSLEKFESKLAALKELEESNCQCEDLFCDPEDEWEPDLTDAPAASFSRRRSRSLVKNRRVSGYLHDIQAHAAPSLPSSRSSALFQEDLLDALWDGVGAGVRLLIDSGLERAEELRRELTGQHPQSETYSVEMPAMSPGGGMMGGGGLDELQKRVPKLIFKKGSRKNTDKSYLNCGKQGPMNSNYDDAMQFSKKRRYLPTATSNSAFSINVGHMVSQPSVIQAAGVSVLESEAPLSLIDSSALNADIKSCHDKSGIPDEVLQSILDQYSSKSESQKEDPFSIAEPRVDLHASGEHSELVPEGSLSPGTQTPSSDKAMVLQEYSKYLQQAFEKSTNAGFALGHGFQFVSLSSPLHNHTLFPEKQIYTTSPLECGFGQSVTSVLPSSLPKPPFGMLFGSQPGLYLSALDATHQQLTPSQELDDLIDSQKNLETSSAFQSSSQKLPSQKEQQKNLESSTSFQMPSQELASQMDPPKDIEPRATYQIENFAQAFGSQFKSGSRVPMTFVSNSNGEVDHRVRTSVSDFSGYTNMMSDVSEPCSTRVKTPTSQSYR
ncbi:Zinc finger protein 281 [Myotis brandtii]|uniref:Zinc finger protein 281 n=1 Tax=Myotis brandtii TaxID=109478 RepID=S7NQE3_MYOBR|nr:Zinc finger protein 281 [Myotis brandtii]